MNIISIIAKEIKQNFRDKKAMTMMILFPVVLIIVLGTALKSAFGNTMEIGTPKVMYKIESKSEAAQNFKGHFIDKGKDFNIDFVETDDINKAKEILMGTDEYACIIEMKEDNKIEVYKNDRYNFTGGLVESILDTYVQKYNVIGEIQKVNPMSLMDIMSDNNTEFTSIASINKKNQPSSLDYYAIVMVTLIIMYGANTGLYGIAGEKNAKTRDRILLGPVRKYEFLIGKTIGCVIVTVMQVAIVILFSKYVLKTNWGSDILTVFLIILSLIIMAISLGVGLGFIFKRENVAGGILNFIIPVVEFLGGGYVPVDGIGGKTFDIITYLSPVRWVNKATLQLIYNNDYSKVVPAIIVNLAIASVFLAVCSLLFRKEGV